MSIHLQRYTTGTHLMLEDRNGNVVEIRETGLFCKGSEPGTFEALIELDRMELSQSNVQELLPYLAQFAETGRFEKPMSQEANTKAGGQ